MSGHAVVSCHVERPLDDAVWAAFESTASSAGPAGSSSRRCCGRRRGSGENDELWLERARRVAASLAPLGHHTHWGGADAGAPAEGVDAAARACARRRRGFASTASSRASSAAAAGTSTLGLAETLAELRLRRLHRDDVPAAVPRGRRAAAAARRAERGCGCRAAHRCSSCRRRTRWACSRAGSLGCPRSSICTSTTGSSSTAGERSRSTVLLRLLSVRRRPLTVDELAERAADGTGTGLGGGYDRPVTDRAAEDVRAARPYLLSRSPLKTFARRLASIARAVLDRRRRPDARPLRRARAARARLRPEAGPLGPALGSGDELARLSDPAARARVLARRALRATRDCAKARAGSCRACCSSRRSRSRSRSAPDSTSRRSACTSSVRSSSRS